MKPKTQWRQTQTAATQWAGQMAKGGQKLTQRDFKFILSTASVTSSLSILEKGPGQKKLKTTESNRRPPGRREYCWLCRNENGEIPIMARPFQTSGEEPLGLDSLVCWRNLLWTQYRRVLSSANRFLLNKEQLLQRGKKCYNTHYKQSSCEIISFYIKRMPYALMVHESKWWWCLKKALQHDSAAAACAQAGWSIVTRVATGLRWQHIMNRKQAYR